MTRDELMQAIWPGSFVEEINLTVNISLLRKTLSEQAGGRQHIATVPKRGYRFDGTVVENTKAAVGSGQTEQPPAVDQTAASKPSTEGITTALPVSRSGVSSRRVAGVAAALLALCASWVVYKYLISARAHGANPSNRSGDSTTSANLHARELYSEGRSYWAKRNPEAVHQSIDRFTQAIAIDPNYSEAYTGLADAMFSPAHTATASWRRKRPSQRRRKPRSRHSP